MASHFLCWPRSLLYSGKPPVCESIADWASEQGLPVLTICNPVVGEAGSVIRNDPRIQGDFEYFREALERPQSLVVVGNAIVKDDVGLVQLPDRQICLEGNWIRELLEQCPAYRRKLPYREQRLSGNVFSLLGYWSKAYHHWFHDVLPRLETALPHLPKDTRFLIHQDPYFYQLESLKAFGITTEKLVFQACSGQSRVERLWFATPIGHCNFSSGAVLRLVGDRLVNLFAVSRSCRHHRLLYISRAKASCRRIVNEAELCPEMNRLGFEVLHCESLSLADQIRIFSEAAVIAGPHGAGLTNMLFSPPGTRVLEIGHPGSTRICYATMAAQLNHEFHHVHARTVGVAHDDCNYELDASVMAQTFRKI